MAKQTQPPYILQIITTDIFVEGTVASETTLIIPKPESNYAPIHFQSARVQTIRTAEVKLYQSYYVRPGSIIAMIPQIDFTQHENYSIWKQYKTAITGEFQLGPYSMTGRLMTLPSGYLAETMPVFDVRFHCQLPGVQFDDLYATFALVGINAIQGWVPG